MWLMGMKYIFCIDSKPIEACRKSRASKCKLGKQNYDTVPSFGYCAYQNTYYYGYKLHVVCGLFLWHCKSKSSLHQLSNDVKYGYHDCTIIGDRGYICKTIQLNLFEENKIEPKRHID